MGTLVTAVLAVTVVAVAVILYGASGGGSPSKEPANPPPSQDPSQEDGAVPPQSNTEISEAEIRDLVSRYGDAYQREDPEAIRALVTLDVEHWDKTSNDVTRNEDAVVALHESRFEAGYALPSLDLPAKVSRVRRRTSAEARFTVADADGRTSSGRVRLDVRREDGKLQIEKIVIEPP